MRRISKKKATERKHYLELKEKRFKEVAKEQGSKFCLCEIGLREGEEIRAQDVHHTEGRNDLNNTSTWLLVSRKWHDRVHFGSNVPLPDHCEYSKDFTAWQEDIYPFHTPKLNYGSKWARYRGYLK